MVHNHDLDPGCREYRVGGRLIGSCLINETEDNMTLTKTKKYFTDCKEVESSNLKKVYYNQRTREMFVEFLNGTVAGYSNVSWWDYRGLTDAASPGRQYNSKVRGVLRGINGDVELLPAGYEPVDLTPVSVSAVAEAYDGVSEADKILSLTPRLDGTEAQPVSGYVNGHDSTVGDKRFSVVVERVTRDTVEVSGKTMEEAVANLDVDGKVVSVTWIARA